MMYSDTHKLNTYFYLVKVKMKFADRFVFVALAICVVGLMVLLSGLDMGLSSRMLDEGTMEEQFWKGFHLDFIGKSNNLSKIERLLYERSRYLDEKKLYYIKNETRDMSHLILHPAYKETIVSLNRPHVNSSRKYIMDWLLSQYNPDSNTRLNDSPWKIAAGWVNERQITPDYAPEIGSILQEMATRRISKADVGHQGTQLKLLLTLDGSQKVVFKPQWYDRDYILTGTPYEGKDRHNGEIASFHFNRLLGLNRSPLVVGRILNLETEIIPVATPELIKTFYVKDKDVCFYGKCHYCKGESTGVCGHGNMLEGVLILWLPPTVSLTKPVKHPWARTYRQGKKATWELYPDGYCESVRSTSYYSARPRLLMDIIDAAISDYIVGNADRHHYETFHGYNNSILVMLDNGKSFGNPTWDVESILAPLSQCCRLRSETWQRLQLLTKGVLSQVLAELLSHDPIQTIIHPSYYTAIERRLQHVIVTIHKCAGQQDVNQILVGD